MAHVAIVLNWLSGMHFHGAYFSNYSSWLTDPLHVCPSAQAVWEIVGQEILNSDLGGNYQGIYITSGLFHLWRSSGITSEGQLKLCSIGLQLCSIYEPRTRYYGQLNILIGARYTC
jgi:photosystem I P700 chlorophyll a apoprotein A1